MASQITSLTIVYSTVYSRCRSKETSKLHFTGLCDENSSVSGEFPAQRANNAENVSIWWRHHATWINHDHGETIKRRCATISYLPIYSSLSGYVRSYRLIDTFNLKPSPLQMHASYAMGYLIWFHQWIHVTVPEDCIVPDNGNPWVVRLLIKTLEDSLDSTDSISPVSTKWRHLKWLTKLERKSRLELNNWIRNLLNLLDEKSTNRQHNINTLRPNQNMDILQTTFSNSFSCIKFFVFWFKFHWNMFLAVKLATFQHPRW